MAWREWGVSMARARFPVNSSSPNSRGIWQAGVAERMVKKPAKRGPKPQSNPSPPSEPARSPAESVNEQTNSGVGHAQSFQIVRSWKKRLGSLAQPDPTHPLAMALDRLTPFCPSLIYHGDTQGFLQRVDHNWSLLASTVRDSEGHVDRLMAILWWYWATMSALRHAEAMGLDISRFRRNGVHVHVPSGAIPKDGPSAGITMATALASSYLGTAVRSDTAMTGEISLSGLVLPVGGIKEKMLAAHRAGIRRIILPKANQKDLKEVPEEVRSEMVFIFVETIEEVLPAAFKPGENVTPAAMPIVAGVSHN